MADPLDLGTPLTNQKHERFAQLVVSGRPQSRAFIEAGFKGATDNAINANASRLITNDKVAARIAELRIPALAIAQAQAEEAVFTAAWILKRAAATHRAASRAKQYGPAIAALSLMAKPLTEFSDKVDARVLHGIVKVERGTRSLT